MRSVGHCTAGSHAVSYMVALKAPMWKWQISLISCFTVQSHGHANIKKGGGVRSCTMIENGEVEILRGQTYLFPLWSLIRYQSTSLAFLACAVLSSLYALPHIVLSTTPRVFTTFKEANLVSELYFKNFQTYRTIENNTMNIHVTFMWFHYLLTFCYICLLFWNIWK